MIATALHYVRTRGARRVVLGGLSNGAVGASLQAAHFQRELAGVVLISGVAPRARPTRVPTLVIHGTREDMLPVGQARAYARAGGTRVRYVELEGGHFVFLSQHVRVGQALRAFCAAVTTSS